MSTSSQGSKPSSGWQPPSLEEMQAMLPQYRFEKLLGRGGMGAVYKAVQASLDRAVAIKVLPGDLVCDDDDAQFAERFKNEARTMAKMAHPSIVNVYEFGETQTGLLYFVMEFIDGTDVAQMILTQGKLPEEYALSITAHVCDALAYAHARGVIHRDIKPANILINMDGQVKVADFGLAKQSDPNQSGLTKTNMAMGTPDFVAPEALIPGIPLDGRADLYAIGVMLYNMLTGEIPRGMWLMPAQKVGSDPRFDGIIAKAMQNDREARYQTATDLRRDLDTILSLPRAVLIAQQQATAEAAARATHTQKQVEASAAAQFTPPPAKPKSGLGPVLGIAATLVLGGGLYWLLNRGAEIIPPPGSTTAAEEPPKPVTVAEAAKPPAELPAPLPPSLPAEKLEFAGHRYELVTTKASWEEAVKLAEAAGGHLATLNSREEHDWMLKTVLPAHSGNKIFLGGIRREKKSPWEWVTGEPFQSEPWMGDFSNDKFGKAHVLSMDGKGLDDVIFEFRPCAYVIEWTPGLKPPALTTPMLAPTVGPPTAMATTDANTPPPVPASPPDSFIAKLESGFQGRYEADVHKGYLAAVNKLDQSYLANGIPKARAAAQARGSLAEVTALDAETARMEKKEAVPAEDAPETPEALQRLRQTYRAAFTQITAERDAKAAQLYDIYLRSLDEHIAGLTKAGKVPEATAAQTWRDQISKLKPVLAVVAPQNKPVTIATAPKAAPTGGGSTWRRTAEYLLNNGGSFVARKGVGTTVVTKEAEIPSGKFDILEMSFDRLGSVLPPPKDEEFHVFNGLRDLRRFWIRAAGPTDAAFAFLSANSDLFWVNFEGVNALTDGVTPHLARLKKLDYLGVQYAAGFTGQGLDQIAATASLTQLELLGCGITDEGIRAISAFKKLQFLRVTSAKVTAAGMTPLASLKTLSSLTMSATAFDDTSAEAIADMTQLTHLDLQATMLTDAGLGKLHALKKLETLAITGTAVSVEAAAEFQKALPQCRVTR